jgi:alpha-tubulin suppressor-like RCC1 family protein
MVIFEDSGEMYSFGLGDQGQLGQLGKTKSYTPGLVRGDHQRIQSDIDEDIYQIEISATSQSSSQRKAKRIFLIATGGRHCLAATGNLLLHTFQKM